MKLTPIGLQIRPMVEDDYRDAFRLCRQLFGTNLFRFENDFSRIFKGFFGKADREAFVATVNDNVIGIVTLYYLDVFHHNGLVASIQELIVTEEFRGRGVGKALVEFVKQQIREKSCNGLEVATDLWQSGARTFYERCGFQGRSYMVAT